MTGRELLAFLQGLSDKSLDAEVLGIDPLNDVSWSLRTARICEKHCCSTMPGALDRLGPGEPHISLFR